MENLITINDFAKILKKPASTIYSWRRNGNIPEKCFLQIGGTLFIKRNIFNEWVA